ncbi:hypothetical protein I302_101323 [Kwoniella bestiolae CBS 10118]|uniref:Uncharacterized protein n=1 Tax=Kwoniella bestiolae CBS 10118 TaxID=1296100 RepID=A0A1B9GBX0_9TREE|nr:hypothetical protein I302_00006 [Kwoniella bestiolae CBS 10118]OCF28519.1 hypothetical protein I302_00006 [Kwoniella bestiolae CBS 10118]
MPSTTILAPPITASILPSSSSRINRISTSSTNSHASTSTSTSSVWTPSRDSVYSVSSDGWSTSLVTPRGERDFDVELLKDVNEDNSDHKDEYINLAGKESWWNVTPKAPFRSIQHEKPKRTVEIRRWLDDSPTLPSSVPLPEIETIPPISLDTPLSKKQLGKLPVRPDTLVVNKSKLEKNVFDVFSSDIEAQNDQDFFASVPIRRPFTKHRAPIPSFSSPTPKSTPVPTLAPPIPSRGSSKRPPIPPLRASSLKSLFAQSASDNQNHITRSSSPTPTPISSHRPKPIRTFSHPPPSSAPLKKHRRISPILLQPISETPKDLDVPPEGSWALRRSTHRRGLSKSKSQPNLRNQNRSPEIMTIKFKLKRSNSTNAAPQDGGSDFMPLDFFPSSRNPADVERDRGEGRSSFSDMARSFVSRPLPESPSRISLDGRPSLSLVGPKNSPKSSNLFGFKKNQKAQSQRRPSLLGLPEWSPRPNPRSISDSCVPQITSSKTFEALTLRTDSENVSPLRLSIDMRRRSGEDLFRRNSTASRHSIASSISSKVNYHLEEDLLAVLDAEKWDWPSPPFRVTRSESTPGLSTSGTLESMISPDPQTPSESEFVLHGEVEYLARTNKEKEQRKEKTWRPMSLEGSLESLNITL